MSDARITSMTIVLLLLAVALVDLELLVHFSVTRTPEGYEDETGFHYVKSTRPISITRLTSAPARGWQTGRRAA